MNNQRQKVPGPKISHTRGYSRNEINDDVQSMKTPYRNPSPMSNMSSSASSLEEDDIKGLTGDDFLIEYVTRLVKILSQKSDHDILQS